MTGSRALRSDERRVLGALRASSDSGLLEQLSDAVVQDAADGTLGIRFIRPIDGQARFSRTVANAEFMDEDGTPVSVALHVDKGGRLMELDFWKADLSPLRRYPAPDQLVMKELPPTAPPESRWEILSGLWRDDIPCSDLGNYVARRAAIIVYIGIAWLPLKFLLTIIDLLTAGSRASEGGYELWCAAFYLQASVFVVIAPISVWRSAVRALVMDHTSCAARIEASWYAAGTVVVLVVPAVVIAVGMRGI